MFNSNIRMLLVLIISVLCVVVLGTTKFDCKNGYDLYINTPDYTIDCDDFYTLTFGPMVTAVTAVDCVWLTKVTFSDSVTSVEDQAFDSCVFLKSAYLGKGLKTIGDHSFYLAQLETLVIPDSVISIGPYAFYNANNLGNLTFGKGLQTIGDYAFYASGINGSLIIPDSVTSIGRFAFAYLYQATSLKIGNGVTTIPEFAFRNNIFSEITLSNSIESIEQYAFAPCSHTTKINWGTGLTRIENNAFYLVGASIKSITFPDSVQYIGDNAFAGCTRFSCVLESVVFGTGLTTIGSYAFTTADESRSFSLSSIEFTGTNPLTIGENAFASTNLTTVVLPEGLQSIGKGAFMYNTNLLSVQLPVSLVNIYASSFQNCTSLSSIGIPNTVTAIGESAFSGCSALQCVYWDETVSRSIGSDAFEGCPLSGCGPSAIPTLRPTAVPSISFRPSISLLPTHRPTVALTTTPSVVPTTLSPTKQEVISEYTFSMANVITGLSTGKFASKKGNKNLFIATVAACIVIDNLDFIYCLRNISISSVTASRGRLLWGGGGGTYNNSFSNILIVYDITFIANTSVDATKIFNTMSGNILNATESGYFTDVLHTLTSYFVVSDAMNSAVCSSSTVYQTVQAVPTNSGDEDPVEEEDDDDGATVGSDEDDKKKGNQTMLVIGLVVGVGGGLWCMVAIAAGFYFYSDDMEKKIVPTDETAKKYEVQMSVKTANLSV